MSPSLVVSSSNKGTSKFTDPYADLRICLWAIENYIPADVQVLVGLFGAEAPTEVPVDQRFHYLTRPSKMTPSAATNWLVDQTEADSFVLVAEDAILHPDSFSMLLEDVRELHDLPVEKLAAVGSRSNNVVGPQNIRCANGGTLALNSMSFDNEDMVFQVECAYTVASWFNKIAFKEAGGFNENLFWFADDLLCFDMRNNNWDTYISRSYVHHSGLHRLAAETGATEQQIVAEDLLWLSKNRPDFYELVK